MAKALKFYAGGHGTASTKIPQLAALGGLPAFCAGRIHVAQSESGLWWFRVENIATKPSPTWTKWERLDEKFFRFTDRKYNSAKRDFCILKKPGLWLGGSEETPEGFRTVLIDETGSRSVRLPG